MDNIEYVISRIQNREIPQGHPQYFPEAHQTDGEAGERKPEQFVLSAGAAELRPAADGGLPADEGPAEGHQAQLR